MQRPLQQLLMYKHLIILQLCTCCFVKFEIIIFIVLEMLIRIPGNVPVGSWSVTVATWYGEKSMNESKYDMEMFNATASDPFYVLFNPFNESE